MDNYKIKLQFKNGNQTVEMGKGFDLRLLEKPTGLDGFEYEVKTNERNHYDGDDVESKRIGKRPIAVTFECPNVEKASETRDQLLRFFDPKQTGTLLVDYCGVLKTIDYEVESLKDNQNNLYEPLKMHVELVCPEPFFKTITESNTEISTWIGGLKFPFKLPFHLKRRGEPRVNIINSGHVETPVQIIFKGPAYNPTVKLLQTREYIRVKRELTSDDTLYIDTTFGVNSVEIERDGIRENAFSAIDWRSDFFQLRVGDNLVEYTTENQLVPQSVEIRFRERYLGA